MNAVFLDDHRLKKREYFFVEIFFDECFMKRFDFLALIKNNTISFEFREYAVVKNTIILLFLRSDFFVDFCEYLQCFSCCFVVFDAFQQLIMVP